MLRIIRHLINIILIGSGAIALGNASYIKMGGGVNQIADIKLNSNEVQGKIKLSHVLPSIELGAGTYLTDSLRADIALNYHFFFLSKERSHNNYGDNFEIRHKAKVRALILSVYEDIGSFNNLTPFVGGGIGISSIYDKAMGYGTNHYLCTTEVLEPVTSKKVYRFAYKLTAGASIELTEYSRLDISYHYTNLGSNKPRVLNGVKNTHTRKYLIHNVTIGIRCNI